MKILNYKQLGPYPDNLSPLPLEGHRRLLVLAPHCDDETLSSAGIIQAALRFGIEVRVVIETNGDGFLFATMEEFRRIYPSHEDFIRMGSVRQQESLRALLRLGVPADHVDFLSYPDRGTPSLWNDYWSAKNPYRSPFSGAVQSPYPITYHAQSHYAGEDLLADLRSILETFHPDLILYPHPDDVHPDHWGLGVFTRLALILMERDDPKYRPDAFAYLVHRPDFPQPKGLLPEASLLPPPSLFNLYPDWMRLDLEEEDIQVKQAAVRDYHSQTPLLHTLLDSFVRSNELFVPVNVAQLPLFANGDPLNPLTWQGEDGYFINPIQGDPTQDLITRKLLPADDLVAVYASRKPTGELAVCAQVRGSTRRELLYTLRITAFDDQGRTQRVARNYHLRPGWQRAVLSGSFACDQVALSDLGDPWLLAVGAEVEEIGVGILDQIAWQFVFVK